MITAAESLAQIGLFRGMSTADIHKVTALAVEIDAAKGATVIREGDPGDALYVILKGQVMVYKGAGEDRQEVLSVLEAGDFFGEMALIDASPRSASVVAVEPSRLLVLRDADLSEHAKEDPQFAARLYRTFAVAVTGRLRRASEKLRRVATESATVKQAVDAMTSEMISVISHELRTPVTVIQNAADLLENVPLPPEKQGKFLANIHKHTLHLAGLLDDIVHLADIQFRDVRIEKQLAPIVPLVQEVVAELEETAVAHKVVVAVELPPDLPPAPIHRLKMRRVLHHLIDNGIKFNREGGTLTIGAEVQGEADPPQLVLTFRDEGPGIPKEEREDLFRCFRQQAGVMDPNRIGGMGLGLPLARSLVAAHGGRLQVESPPGGGSCFSITIPMEESFRPCRVW